MTLPRAKKSFGQNFLTDPSVIRKIIAAAEIVPGETVLEVGPGTGVLTEALVAAGARVIAVEADHDLVGPLQERFGDKITLVEGDILSVDLRELVRPDETDFKLVANIPYNITSDLLFRFLTQEPRPTRMVLMVQKEVADRITAKPPDMGLLSVVCQVYAAVKKVTHVPRGAFRPMPKVESAVVRLDLQPRIQQLPPESVIRFAKIGFSHPRKQLQRNLLDAGVGTSEKIKAFLTSRGLPETARAENLRVEDWLGMVDAI